MTDDERKARDDEIARRACDLLQASIHLGSPRLRPETCVKLISTIWGVASSPFIQQVATEARADPVKSMASVTDDLDADETKRRDAEAKVAREQAELVKDALASPQR